MMPTASTFSDSSSTLGDYDYSLEGDGSGSRWDHEEVPAFPLPFCSRISPKLPRRQRTLENHEEDDMIAIMMSAVDGIPTTTVCGGGGGSHDPEEISVTNPSFDEQDIDCPKQLDMTYPTGIPTTTATRRQITGNKNHDLSPLRRSSPHSTTSNRRALAQMRFQCLILKSNRLQHRQNSKRSMLVVDANDATSSLTGERSSLLHKSSGSRASTI